MTLRCPILQAFLGTVQRIISRAFVGMLLAAPFAALAAPSSLREVTNLHTLRMDSNEFEFIENAPICRERFPLIYCS